MKEGAGYPGAGVQWLLLMAWRDGKSGWRRLTLFMSSIILGIAAVVAIQSFSQNLKENIVLQSKALMGADYIIDSNQVPNEKVQQIIDSLGGAKVREVTFASMASFPEKGGTKLVEVRGIEGPFPLYGNLETVPETAAAAFRNNAGALVDATVMLQFQLQPGDTVKIGELTFPILGSLQSAPGSTALRSSVAPAVMIPYDYIEATGLLQLGSRQEYKYYFKSEPDTDLELLDERIDLRLDAENADLDTHTSTSERLGRRYDNVGRFLNLVAFIALLLGCVGIASSVNIYMKEKLRAVAMLKCLGASRRQTLAIFLLQIAGMGLMGGIIGTVGGILLQFTFPMILRGFLPFDVQITFTLIPVLMGLLLGIVMSVLFALLPLMGTWYVSPLQVLRIQDEPVVKSRRAILIILAMIMGCVYLFAFWILGDPVLAIGFLAGVLATFGILALMSHLMMRTIKKYFPENWSFTARQSLLNMFRPNNQTMTLLLAIGVGSFLISTLYFTKDILLDKATLESDANSPNLILLDVQSDQVAAVASGISDKGLPLIDRIPIITMRVQSINGRAANDIRMDSTSKVNQWILNHEFRVTYRDSLIASERLEEGKWTGKLGDSRVVPISISDNVARDARVGIGDSLTFNVQGLLMNTVVGSIRSVDWGRMQLNFSVVFPNGVLENAPQFYVLSTKAPDERASAELQRVLVKEFPNVSIIDLRQVVTLIEGILDKISWIINFMAFFSILTGIVVLIGAVRTSKYQRIRESALFRTLGARSHMILRMAALEYIYLGGLGCVFGILLSLIGSQMLALFVFEMPFSPSLIPFVILLPAIIGLVLTIGLINTRSILNHPPLEVIRKEVR